MAIMTLASPLAWILLLLRLVTGLLFMLHGYPKLTKRKQTEDFLQKIGLPRAFGPLSAIAEFFGGLAIFLGLLTSVVATLMAIWMVGTTVVSITKLKKPLLTGMQPGYELDITYLLLFLTLASLGAGPISLDGALKL